MSFRKTFAIISILTAVLAFAGTSYSQVTIKLTWEVVRYDISATLPGDFRTGRDLDVEAALTVKNISDASASTLSLRISDQARISSVTAGGTAADFRSSPETTGGAAPLQRTVVSIPPVSPGQTSIVTVRYKLNVKENDGLAALSPTGSQFLPFSFWYPTPTTWFFTGGADFAQIGLTVNAGAGIRVFSSGTASGSAYETGIKGQPFFVAGPYESTSINGVEIVYPRRGAVPVDQARLSRLAEITTRANQFLSTRLGGKLTAPLRIICVKRGSGFADSGTVLIDDAVLVREKPDSSSVQSIVEGIAKSYLGNVVTVRGDGYGVIREGLARFISNEFIESEFGEQAAAVERLRQRTSYSAISDRDSPLSIVSPADGYFYTATANKGSIIWAYLEAAAGENFYSVIRERSSDGEISLQELRAAFSGEKAYLDYALDRVTQMNLMVGLPVKANGRITSAVRNLGEIHARVVVTATTATGKKIRVPVTVRAREFGEAVFDTGEEIIRVEIDESKLYPQSNFSDDVAPRIADDPDPLLFVKRELDRQNYSEAETHARTVLSLYPEFHDVRVLLARAQLAQGKVTDAGRNFEQVLAFPLPSAQSLAWAKFGLGEIAQKTGQAGQAGEKFREAILADADYGATLGAVRALAALGGAAPAEEIRNYFASFDKAVVSNSKAEVEALLAGGEVSRFAVSVAGQAQQWATTVRFVQEVDGVDILIGANVQLKLLNRDIESGVALFRLSRTPAGLKLTGVDIFEVS